MSVYKKISPGLTLILLVLVAGFQTACHRKALTAPPVAAIPAPDPDTTAPAPGGISSPYPVAGLQKTPCFGSCPVFEATVFSDGTAIWHGIRNTTRLGKYEARVSHQWLNQLLADAEALGFFQMAVQYPLQGNLLPDVPQTVTFIRDGAKQRRVTDNASAPVALLRFEKILEEKLDSLDWKPLR